MKFHHIGFVVKDIEKYESKMIFDQKIAEIFDPIQQAKLALYSNFSQSYIELIQPMNENSFTFNFLQKFGEKAHHLCYEIESELEMKELISKQKLVLFKGPLKAILFNNRVVYFAMDRNKNIIEFLL